MRLQLPFEIIFEFTALDCFLRLIAACVPLGPWYLVAILVERGLIGNLLESVGSISLSLSASVSSPSVLSAFAMLLCTCSCGIEGLVEA